MRGWVRAAWRGMGPWKWLGVAAILTVIVLTPETAQGDASSGPADRTVATAGAGLVPGRR